MGKGGSKPWEMHQLQHALLEWEGLLLSTWRHEVFDSPPGAGSCQKQKSCGRSFVLPSPDLPSSALHVA